MKKLNERLTTWYSANKRDLPWRTGTNPYAIWLSEIILQQTKVAQGVPYYDKFMLRYPDIIALSEAPINDVLKLWQGLGYYSRAKNLHKAAQLIVNEYNSVFPPDYNELLKLPGVGKYTAAAIASIAYNERVAVVDGNVYRVVSRLFGIEIEIGSNNAYKLFNQKMLEMMRKSSPGDFNQAVMEFGALQCVRNPDCDQCMVNDSCYAYKNDAVALLPKTKKKKQVRIRYLNYFIVQDENHVLMRKRESKDIWNGLYEFVLFESDHLLDVKETPYPNQVLEIINRKHKLTHQTLFIRFFVIRGESNQMIKDGYETVDIQQLIDLPVCKPIEYFIQDSVQLANIINK